jgi:hypothetical protein
MQPRIQIGDQVRRIDSAIWETGEVVALTSAGQATVRWFGGRETPHAVAKLAVIDPTSLVPVLTEETVP